MEHLYAYSHSLANQLTMGIGTEKSSPVVAVANDVMPFVIMH